MEKVKQNKMGIVSMSKLIWKMGLPMIISMILQSVYNIVDTAFVINMGEAGINGNLALTYAFPIQLLIIAIGVGTGVGINALLSKKLGEKDHEGVARTTGNGIFLAFCIYLVFLIFGLFGSYWFISMQAGDSTEVVTMGTNYLTICCTLSFGSIGYCIYERFLQSTGKTLHSTIAQITGAVANIVLDYVFIYPLGMGVEGAAWATIIGQILSLIMAMIFHYCSNKEIKNGFKYLLPKWSVIKGIYQIGISAAIMQGLLSVMMLGMNLILGTASMNVELLQGSFGIYYKIMQFALFAAFGLSNTIISILSFNYGMKDKTRVKSCIKFGLINSIIVSIVITILFEALASPLAKLFGMAGGSGNEIQEVVVTAIRIASIGYIFMTISVVIQGVLQAFRYAISPLIISFLRLCVLVLPIAYLFTLSSDAVHVLWWTFPIVEVITTAVSLLFLKYAYDKKVKPMEEKSGIVTDNLVVTISREHGSNGKYIGKLLAEKLGLKYYDKEIIGEVAKETGLAKEYLQDMGEDSKTFHTLYLSTKTNEEAIIAQAKVISEIVQKENCLIVGRGADFILRDCPNVINIFIYADKEYKINTIMKLYGDSKEDAIKHIKNSNRARGNYYKFISQQEWGKPQNYHLCIDSSFGPEITAETLAQFVKNFKVQEVKEKVNED